MRLCGHKFQNLQQNLQELNNYKMIPDFKKIFEKLPENYAVVESDYPDFTLVAVSDSHLKNIGIKREDFVGEKLF